MSGAVTGLFDFERPRSREIAFVALLVAAVLSPNIDTPGALPAVRGEQILLAALLPSLALYYWRNPATWRLGLIDAAFVALGFAMAVTLVLAPLTLSAVSWSLRDPFELARVAEYWLLYRLALTLEPEPAIRRAVPVMFALAIGLSAFALLQYLDWGSFNERVTGIWAVAHNLDGVERTGRTVGTIGNANYFGAFAGLLLVAALAVLLLRVRERRWQVLAVVAAVAATFAVVTAQSRTAVLGLLFALMVGLVLVAWQRRLQAAYATTIGLFLVSTVASITFVQAVPPDVGSFSARFAPSGLVDDSSVTIRFSRWRSIFAGFLDSGPSFCEGERFETRPISGTHEPAGDTGWPEADEAARERDETRKDDVATITRAVLDYYCDEGEWPSEQPLVEALVPEHLDELPLDPATGEPYPSYVGGSGFTIGAELEDPADPEGPRYTLGTIPNISSNPSFDGGEPEPVRWRLTGDATVQAVNDDHLFGERAAQVEAAPGAGYLDTVVFNFGRDRDYTAAIWVRPLGAEPITVQLYLAATLSDGTAINRLAAETFELDPGRWTQVELPFRTPEDGRITALQFIVRVPDDAQAAEFLLDGSTVAEGTFAPGFVRVSDVDPATLRDDGLPRFADSPLFGAGPRKDIELGNLDNEYALFLDRFGLLGTAAYLALFGSALLVGWRAWTRGQGVVATLGLVMVTFTLLLAVFNITAGSYYHFQIMAVYWLLTGVLAAAVSDTWARRLDRG